MRNSVLTLRKVLLILTPVTLLAGCTTSGKPPVNFLELSSVVSPLVGAKGKTLEDQRKIDRTIAASCATGVIGWQQCDTHTGASSSRMQELRTGK